MVKSLSKEEAQGLTILIVLGVIGFLILILQIQIGIIHMFQKLFWIFLSLIPVSALFCFLFLLWGFFKEEEQTSNDSYWGEQDFFDRPMIFIFSGGFFILIFLSFLGTTYAYEQGYSNEALDNLAKLENQLKNLQEIKNILTGQIIWDIQNQVMEDTISNLCKDPNYPCNQVKQSYEVYKDIKGAKDNADDFADFLGIIERTKQNQ
ncbi:MAG: hypothetical protein Q7R87_04285 [Nanoarchaeota archaeon]|nr:hypothetical protein [Nanoarchaeota archaeon]